MFFRVKITSLILLSFSTKILLYPLVLTLYNSPKKCFTFQAAPSMAIMALVLFVGWSDSITNDTHLGRIRHFENQKAVTILLSRYYFLPLTRKVSYLLYSFIATAQYSKKNLKQSFKERKRKKRKMMSVSRKYEQIYLILQSVDIERLKSN